jgi:hypothetical protein
VLVSVQAIAGTATAPAQNYANTPVIDLPVAPPAPVEPDPLDQVSQ